MELVKKSFNTSGDLAQRIDDFIKSNPGISFTWLMNQAIINWLNNPQVTLVKSKPFTDDDVNRFMDEHKDLMTKLSK